MTKKSHRHWLSWLLIVLLLAAILGVLFYQFVVKANEQVCTRRFLKWEWREKDCNVLEELVN